MLLVSNSNPLAIESWVRPEQLVQESLITFPEVPERLDILTLFL
jgi:hypothetical protein